MSEFEVSLRKPVAKCDVKAKDLLLLSRKIPVSFKSLDINSFETQSRICQDKLNGIRPLVNQLVDFQKSVGIVNLRLQNSRRN